MLASIPDSRDAVVDQQTQPLTSGSFLLGELVDAAIPDALPKFSGLAWGRVVGKMG